MARYTPLVQAPQNRLLGQLLASQRAPRSIGEGIFTAGQALQQGLAAYGENRQQQKRQQQQQQLAQRLLQGLDPAQAAQVAPLLQNEATAPMAQQALLAQALAGPPDPVALSPGQALVNPQTGQPVAQLPDRARTVGAGGALVGPDGNIILEREPAAPVSVNVGTGDFKVPANFMRDPNNPSQVVPIPGGPAERESSQEAGRIQLLRSGLQSLNKASSAIFEGGNINSGAINREAIALSNAPVVGSVPGTEGVDIRNQIENAVEAKLRAETGAAATQDEINRLMQRFMPGITDNEETIRSKFKGLREFLRGSIELTGQNAPAEARSGGGVAPAPAPQRLGEANAGAGEPPKTESGRPNFGQLTREQMSDPTLLENATEEEARAFMKRARELGLVP